MFSDLIDVKKSYNDCNPLDTPIIEEEKTGNITDKYKFCISTGNSTE